MLRVSGNTHSIHERELVVVIDEEADTRTRKAGSPARREFIIDIREDFPPVMGDCFLLEQM